MGSFMDQFKLKDGLSYLASNKVRIASFKYKWNKKVFNDYFNNCLIKNEYTEG